MSPKKLFVLMICSVSLAACSSGPQLKTITEADTHRFIPYDSVEATGMVKMVDGYEQKEGKWEFFAPGSKQLLYSGQFKDGERDGEWKWLDSLGKTLCTAVYNGNKVRWEWFRDGDILKQVGHYTDNQKDGKWEWYYPSGELGHVEEYKEGKAFGKWIDYAQNGKEIDVWEFKEATELGGLIISGGGGYSVISTSVDENKNGLVEAFHKNGKLNSKIRYEQGKLMEVLELYDENGKKLDPGNVVDGNGIRKTYFSNGQLWGRSAYRNGFPSTDTTFHQNGKTAQIQAFDENLQAHGYFVIFEENSGEIVREGVYKNGIQEGVWRFRSFTMVEETDTLGSVQMDHVGFYEAGRLLGTEKIYDMNGKLMPGEMQGAL